EKAQSQQYLTLSEEKALVKYLLQMSRNGFPIPVKYLGSLAYIIACRRSSAVQPSGTNVSIDAPGKNWPQAFKRRHPTVQVMLNGLWLPLILSFE
ncbi:hypothetical protein P152DRAFT_406124, partial [Eremomyces bilateralis CBS 781.70]